MVSSESCWALLLSPSVAVTWLWWRCQPKRHMDKLHCPQRLGILCVPRRTLWLDIQCDCNSVLPAKDSRTAAPVVPLAMALSKDPEEPQLVCKAHRYKHDVASVWGQRLYFGFQRERKGNLNNIMSDIHPSLPETGSLKTCIMYPHVDDFSYRDN